MMNLAEISCLSILICPYEYLMRRKGKSRAKPTGIKNNALIILVSIIIHYNIVYNHNNTMLLLPGLQWWNNYTSCIPVVRAISGQAKLVLIIWKQAYNNQITLPRGAHAHSVVNDRGCIYVSGTLSVSLSTIKSLLKVRF